MEGMQLFTKTDAK